MSKVSDYIEAPESVSPNGGWLFIAERQPNGTFKTKKIAPHNVGAVGPAGPQGLQGANGAAGANGAKGDKGDTGATGSQGLPGTNGTNGTNGQDALVQLSDSWSLDSFESYSLGAISTLDGGSGWAANGVVTGGTIVSKNISGGRTEKRLSLAGPGEFGRKFLWGEKWKRLRIGIICRINGGATITNDFNFGLCSGTTNMFGSATCANFIGGSTRNGNANQFTYSAGTDAPYFDKTFAGLGTKHNATFVDSLGLTGTKSISAGESFRTIQVFEVARSLYGVTANNYICGLFGPSSGTTGQTSPQCDVEYGAMLNAVGQPRLDNSSFPYWDGNSASGTISHSETFGALDTVNIWWGHATTPIEISAVAVFKLC